MFISTLNQELFDLIDEGNDLGFQFGGFVGGDGDGNDGTSDTASTTKCRLGGNKNVRNVFIFTQKRQVQQDFEGLGISSHDNKLGNTAVEGLGGFVGSLAELLVMRGLLDQVQDAVGEGGVG